jgi:predicted ArsR family transcriptional regulator
MPLDDSERDNPPLPELRQITDVHVLRALTHPVRIALIEILSVEGPMTATQAGERIGESPTTCSFHLRQLAKYDFVEEAGGGKGRARPWRMTTIGMSFSIDYDDPAAAVASSALSRMVRERQLARYQRWRDTRSSFPAEWRDAAGDMEFVSHLTAAELKDLNEDLMNLVRSRFGERLTDPAARPEGSTPVELLVFSYPMDLPGPAAG